MTIRLCLCVLALAACAPHPGLGPAPSAPSSSAALSPAASEDQRAIAAMPDAFRAAMAAHDGQALLGLMLGPDVPFQSVLATPAPPQRSTAGDFAALIAQPANAWDEKFSDVQITSDGALGVLDARYEFYSAGKLGNSGREVWVLLRTPAGWKITSVTWSIRLPPPGLQPAQ
jgi:hypothetical protein